MNSTQKVAIFTATLRANMSKLKLSFRLRFLLQNKQLNNFQNVHLVAKWLSTLEKKLETYSVGSHENYRVFISAEPASTRDAHIIPQGILESSIKITNEPPTGMQANLHKALDNFSQVFIRRSLAQCFPLFGLHILFDTKSIIMIKVANKFLSIKKLLQL